ncbi:MAG: serine hydrolase [Christensenellales bacterium]|jgi:CubicO group peptidase (beta-lactamase class C family)
MHALSKKLSHLLAYALAIIILAGTWSAGAEMTVPSGLSTEEFSLQASVLLREAAGQQAQGLALVLFSDTGILASQGFGLADPAGQKPVLPDQIGFEYGSVSKVLVSLSPAGGVRGTAEDLAKLGIALLSRDARLLSKSSSYDLLFSDSFAPFPGADGTAHGFFTMNAQHAKGYQHPGNTNGFTAQITLVPEFRIGYVLLTNTAYTNPLSSALNHLLIGPPAQRKCHPPKSPRPKAAGISPPAMPSSTLPQPLWTVLFPPCLNIFLYSGSQQTLLLPFFLL